MLLNTYMCPHAQITQGHGLSCHQYADDTVLCLTIGGQPDTILEVLDRALQTVAGWLRHNQLKLNPIKMQVLHLSHGGLESGIQIPVLDEMPLVSSPNMRSLGVILDGVLSLEAQVTTCH